MNNFVIFTDSSCDLTPELIEKYDLHVIQLDVSVDGSTPVPNNQIDIKEFYSDLRAGKTAKTNAINMELFKEEVRKCASEGMDVLYVGFSSGLSATFNNGRLALEEVKDEFPGRTLLAADSLCASLGQGLLVYYVAEMRERGKDIHTVYQFVEDHKLNICHQFTVDDLFFLKRGGRINAATAIVGSMLGVKPVLHVDDEGHLINIGKARGRKAAILSMFNRMKETAQLDQYNDVYISHGDCIEDAKFLADLIENEYHPASIVINNVGPVIGAHSGPGTLALFYYGTER